MIKLTKISKGSYQYQDYRIHRSKYRALGDNRERYYWKVFYSDDATVFDTLKEVREFINDRVESIEQK